MRTKAALKGGLAIVAVLACFASTTANAQWLTSTVGGSFDDDALHLAITVDEKFGFGLRCKTDSIEFVYMTNDGSMTDEAYKMVNASEPKLRIRADKGDIITLDTNLEDAKDGNMMATSSGTLPLYQQIKDAHQSISVVITALGKNYHEHKFNARGVKEAVSKIISGCKLSEAKKQ